MNRVVVSPGEKTGGIILDRDLDGHSFRLHRRSVTPREDIKTDTPLIPQEKVYSYPFGTGNEGKMPPLALKAVDRLHALHEADHHNGNTIVTTALILHALRADMMSTYLTTGEPQYCFPVVNAEIANLNETLPPGQLETFKAVTVQVENLVGHMSNERYPNPFATSAKIMRKVILTPRVAK